MVGGRDDSIHAVGGPGGHAASGHHAGSGMAATCGTVGGLGGHAGSGHHAGSGEAINRGTDRGRGGHIGAPNMPPAAGSPSVVLSVGRGGHVGSGLHARSSSATDWGMASRSGTTANTRMRSPPVAEAAGEPARGTEGAGGSHTRG